jgi:hypothetical protein
MNPTIRLYGTEGGPLWTARGCPQRFLTGVHAVVRLVYETVLSAEPTVRNRTPKYALPYVGHIWPFRPLSTSLGGWSHEGNRALPAGQTLTPRTKTPASSGRASDRGVANGR